MEGPNPYAPPAADFDANAPVNEHEATRRRLIGSETNIRSLGSLLLVGGVFTVLANLGALSKAPVDAIIGLATAAMALYAGLALRKLDTIGRTLYTVIAALAVVRIAYVVAAVPGGSELMPAMLLQVVVVALFLALLWGKNAKEIFTDHYRRVVIPATPFVKYKTSTAAIVVLVILVLLVLSAIVAIVVV